MRSGTRWSALNLPKPSGERLRETQLWSHRVMTKRTINRFRLQPEVRVRFRFRDTPTVTVRVKVRVTALVWV